MCRGTPPTISGTPAATLSATEYGIVLERRAEGLRLPGFELWPPHGSELRRRLAGYGCVDHRCKLISRHVRGRQLTFGQRKWWCQLNAYSEDCDAEFMLGRLASVLVPSHSSNPPLLSWLWPHSPNRRTTLRRAALPKHPSICYVHINKAGGAALTTGLQRLQRQGMVSRVAELHIPWSFGPTPWYRTKAANASWKPGPWKPGWYFPPGPLRMDSCLGYEIVLCGYEIRSTASSRPSSFLGWKEMEAQVVWKP